MKMKVTIRDVAKKAGVSITTVSRALNHYTDISEETKNKIIKIAEEMNYFPNTAARTLSSKKAKKIALILNELNIIRKSSIEMEILSGVYNFTRNNDIEFTLLFTTKEQQQLKSLEQTCYEQNIDGAIIQGLDVTDPYCVNIAESNIPAVLIDIASEGQNTGSASIDNAKASEEAVSYLIELGHKKIAYISGKKQASVAIERERGYTNALNKYDIPIRLEYIQYANFSEDIAYVLAKEFIKENPEVTAFFCASDLMAIGVMRAIQDLGYSVPEDYSVIGFDDAIISEYISPSLTTISQNMQQIGYASGNLLMKLIDSGDEKIPESSKRIYLPHKFIKRESTAKVRSQS